MTTPAEQPSLPSPTEDPKYVPDTYVGKLEPNFYCRAWNHKRQKYCRARAGRGTDHPGVGRCGQGGHDGGGSKKLKHGLSRRYDVISHERLRDLVAHFEADPDPLNIEPELNATRALFVDWINRYFELRTALLTWYALMSQKVQRNPALENVLARLLEEAPQRQLLDISDGYRLLSEVSQIVVRIQKARSENAISRPNLYRIMGEMGRVVERHVQDEATLERIKDQWLSIAI